MTVRDRPLAWVGLAVRSSDPLIPALHLLRIDGADRDPLLGAVCVRGDPGQDHDVEEARVRSDVGGGTAAANLGHIDIGPLVGGMVGRKELNALVGDVGVQIPECAYLPLVVDRKDLGHEDLKLLLVTTPVRDIGAVVRCLVLHVGSRVYRERFSALIKSLESRSPPKSEVFAWLEVEDPPGVTTIVGTGGTPPRIELLTL